MSVKAMRIILDHVPTLYGVLVVIGEVIHRDPLECMPRPCQRFMNGNLWLDFPFSFEWKQT